jgi:hypothetical protein
MTTIDDREERLPRWAQQELQRLRGRIEQLEERVAAAFVEDIGKGAPVVATTFDSSPPRLRELIIPYDTINFRTSFGTISASIDRLNQFGEKGTLTIRTLDRTSLLVRPIAGNSLSVFGGR